MYHHGYGHDHHASGTSDKLAAIPDELYKRVLLDAEPPGGTNIRARPALGRNNTLRGFDQAGERAENKPQKASNDKKTKKNRRNLSEKGKESTVKLLNELLKNGASEEQGSRTDNKQRKEGGSGDDDEGELEKADSVKDQHGRLLCLQLGFIFRFCDKCL